MNVKNNQFTLANFCCGVAAGNFCYPLLSQQRKRGASVFMAMVGNGRSHHHRLAQCHRHALYGPCCRTSFFRHCHRHRHYPLYR